MVVPVMMVVVMVIVALQADGVLLGAGEGGACLCLWVRK